MNRIFKSLDLSRWKFWGDSSLIKTSNRNLSLGMNGQQIPVIYPAPVYKFKVFVLCANQDSFNMFSALGTNKEDNDKYEYVFVSKAEDFKGDGYIKIFNDFCLNPNIESILEAMNDVGLYYREKGNNMNNISGNYTGDLVRKVTQTIIKPALVFNRPLSSQIKELLVKRGVI